MPDMEDRCRLVLIAPRLDAPHTLADVFDGALRGGDVASVILPQYDLADHEFQQSLERAVPVIQKAGVAVLVAGDTRIAGRTGADGIHVTGDVEALAAAVERFSPKLIVGGGNAKTRDAALGFGEVRPDYVFFGAFEGDIKSEAHPKNLALGEWWASMIEIPCIVMGGSAVESVLDVARSGCEFVALGSAVFKEPADAARLVAEANAMLDDKAPRFEG